MALQPPPPPPLSVPWLGTWSHAPDRVAQAALAGAVVLLALALIPGGPRAIAWALDAWGIGDLARRRRFLFVTSLLAAFLSLGYVEFYLRGGPRAPEAAAYWIQGRALSHARLAWTAPDPVASFRAQGIAFTAPDRLAGARAPGYPLLLAIGFLLGAPMLAGPLIAAGLVVATWLLAHEIAAGAGETTRSAETTARLAAGLSIASAALRYHTAEALPYGAAALAAAAALAFALRARRTADARWFAAAGAAVGAAGAAHPPAAVAIGAVVLGLALRSARPARAAAWTAAAALPGALWLLAAHRAATGHALGWTLAASGGAGAAAGGHATFAAFLREASRGLRRHLADVANFEPLALLPLLLAFGKNRTRIAVAPALVVAGGAIVHAGLALAHVGPAAQEAGAWLRSGVLVEALPIEQALIALALVRTFARAVVPAGAAALALALGGFALHVSYDHERIAASGIGRPAFEPDVAREAGVTHGLIFFDDDEGYELAADPGAAASHGIEAARFRGDDHDRLLYDVLGHPPAHRYVTSGASRPALRPFVPSSSDTWRFEAEADAPPPAWWARGAPQPAAAAVADARECGAGDRVVSIGPGGRASIELPVPRGATPGERRRWTIVPRVFDRGGGARGSLDLETSPGGPSLAHWAWTETARAPRCYELAAQTVELGGDRAHAWWVLSAAGGSVALDRTVLRAEAGRPAGARTPARAPR